MDNLFSVFLCWQSGVLCLGVYLITYVLRTLAEGARPWIKGAKFYNEAILPLAPIFIGALLGWLSHKFPWPVPLASSTWARVMYGGICGMASGWLFSRFRALLRPAPDAAAAPAADPLAAVIAPQDPPAPPAVK